MKSLKLFITLLSIMCVSGNILHSQEEITALNKGQEIVINYQQQNQQGHQATSNQLVSTPNANCRFYFRQANGKWEIKDFTTETTKYVEFYTTGPKPGGCIGEKIVLEQNGNLKCHIMYDRPVLEMHPSPPWHIIVTLATNCDRLELTDQGGLVAKNAAGTTIWGPVYGM
ncbi:MAG: hypothetical protein IPN49_09805 [Saprospiraceae bacterium]|nr:hypothetical protein [Saprospiraceae bacterium]